VKILLSAFACIPHVGSEGGVGWFWAEEWAKDHDVVVVTDITRRPAIEAELARNPRSRVQFVYFRPNWLRWMPLNSSTAQVLYQLWQVGLVSFARHLHGAQAFDLAHHVTYGVFRQPTFLGRVGIPTVFGPVGGGEDAPWRLKKSMTRSDRRHEFLRTSLNRWAQIDPMLKSGLRRCAAILVKTGATARALPRGFEDRVHVALEIGTVPRQGVVAKPAPLGRPLRLIYAGSLFGLKGMHLGLHALALAHQRGIPVQLSIVGDGPQVPRLRAQAQDLGIANCIDWIDRLPQAELFALYRSHDVLLFPSLHDSSGNVLMEALSFAMPIICLDLGGPADIVTEQCGRMVQTGALDEAGVIQHLADAVASLATDPALFARLSAGALVRSNELDWSAQATHIKRLAMSCVTTKSTREQAAK
jgi:glycosyltransferase involved in cell wall biosynthesis